uniref:Uncharacterized protein n=1 Tax=Panagrolaimus sp. JU765 TaxID=591449 RepID=A0AC34RPV2_9BILA
MFYSLLHGKEIFLKPKDMQEKLSPMGIVVDERPTSAVKESSVNAPLIPPPPIVIQTRDIEFTDFNNSQAIADDLASNFDESLSMISDDDSQMPFDIATQLGDDIFPEIAEEAVEVDEGQLTKRQLKQLEKNVNALNATLSDFNVVLFSAEGQSMVSGYSAKLTIAQDLNIPLKNIVDKYRAASTIPSDKTVSNQAMKSKNEESFKEACLQFQVKTEGIGKNKYAHIIAKVQNLNANIDEQIVSYLGPFIQDDDADDDPVFLELSVEKSNLKIVNPKKRNPLKLKIGQLEIIDDNKNS